MPISAPRRLARISGVPPSPSEMGNDSPSLGDQVAVALEERLWLHGAEYGRHRSAPGQRLAHDPFLLDVVRRGVALSGA